MTAHRRPRQLWQDHGRDSVPDRPLPEGSPWASAGSDPPLWFPSSNAANWSGSGIPFSVPAPAGLAYRLAVRNPGNAVRGSLGSQMAGVRWWPQWRPSTHKQSFGVWVGSHTPQSSLPVVTGGDELLRTSAARRVRNPIGSPLTHLRVDGRLGDAWLPSCAPQADAQPATATCHRTERH